MIHMRNRYQLRQMEWHVFQTLNWAVGHLTVNAFLQLALSDKESVPGVGISFIVHNDEGHGESD
jgi:hypothetical protein